jgi:hypothetical protein
LPAEQVTQVVGQGNFWEVIVYLMGDLGAQLRQKSKKLS